MPNPTFRALGYAVVAACLASLAFGLTMLFAVLDFFGLEGASAAEVAGFMQANLGRFTLALVATLAGYLLAVPVMLMVTAAAFGAETSHPLRRHFALGLVWASLPLRPIWWAALITLAPALVATLEPGADPASATATFVVFQSLSAVFNTVTEDIAVNILGGGWFVLVSLAILATGHLPRLVGWIGLVLGGCYLLSSAELFGLSFGEGGGFIPMLAGVSGPFWLAAAGALSVRRVL